MEYLSCDPGSCVGIWFYGGVAGAFELDGIFCKFKFGCTGGVTKNNITFIESNIVFMTSNLSRISAYNGIPGILPARASCILFITTFGPFKVSTFLLKVNI